jgi:hypothetical protein
VNQEDYNIAYENGRMEGLKSFNRLERIARDWEQRYFDLIKELAKAQAMATPTIFPEVGRSVAELERDAARYRYLLANSICESDDGTKSIQYRCDFDNWDNVSASIDAAMQGK